jgi:hypothetical protein
VHRRWGPGGLVRGLATLHHSTATGTPPPTIATTPISPSTTIGGPIFSIRRYSLA